MPLYSEILEWTICLVHLITSDWSGTSAELPHKVRCLLKARGNPKTHPNIYECNDSPGRGNVMHPLQKKIVPSQEESSVIICVCRPEEVADTSTLQGMLGAPAVQHLQRSLQPVRDEGKCPCSCSLRQMRNKIVPSKEESSVIICVCRPEEVADASTLQGMLGAPAVQHLQRSLQPVRDEGKCPCSCRLRQMRNKIVPSQEESSVIICVCRPEEVADASTLQGMLGAPAVQHLQRSLQPVRDEGKCPCSCRLRQMRNKIVPSQEESSVIICVCRPEEVADASTLQGMLGAPAVQHLQRSLQPVRDEGKCPCSCRLRQMRNKIVPSQEESSVIICVCRPEEVADASTLQGMLGAPAVQHLQRSLQPVREEGKCPCSCRLRQMRNKIVPSQEESSVIICVSTRRSS
ncbi:hypothetical protein TNCV_566191 [Trichonephila clavipes]|nr:hypothetical protein TNCV_566191 [Trichonephila clavipes]